MAGREEGSGPWARARAAARRTPESRNRYVDFVRAAAIVVVVIGHWLMAAPTVESGVRFTLSDMLGVAPWTQWLTWIFQVMPLFFVVGGYANAASWSSARRSGTSYDAWVSRRLQRLVWPVVPFIFVWCALGLTARWLGLGREVVRSGSEAAFVPTWFLAVYVLVVVLAPAMHRLWRDFGWASFWGLVVGAAVVDMVSRGLGVEPVSWLNYVFVWLAIHQLGFAWRDGAFADASRAAGFALAGAAGLVVLEGLASYPVSMVTVPGDTPANSNPPTLALLALGVIHSGVVVALEERGRKLLARTTLWTATVFVNGVIMTVYLWHATVMVLAVGIAEWPGGIGLRFTPNTPAWWATRLPWIVVLLAILALFVAAFGSIEARQPRALARPPSRWWSVAGAVSLCAGLVTLANFGIWGSNPLGVRLWPVLLAGGGALLVVSGRVFRAPADDATGGESGPAA